VPQTLSGWKIDAENGFQWQAFLAHGSKTPAMNVTIGPLRPIHR